MKVYEPSFTTYLKNEKVEKIAWDETGTLSVYKEGYHTATGTQHTQEALMYKYYVPKEFGDNLMQTFDNLMYTPEVIDLTEALFKYFLDKVYRSSKYGYTEVKEAFDYLINSFPKDCGNLSVFKIGVVRGNNIEPSIVADYSTLPASLTMKKNLLALSHEDIIRNEMIDLLQKDDISFTIESKAMKHLKVINDVFMQLQENMLAKLRGEIVRCCPDTRFGIQPLNLLWVLSDVDCRFDFYFDNLERVFETARERGSKLNTILEEYVLTDILNDSDTFALAYQKLPRYFAMSVYDCNFVCKQCLGNINMFLGIIEEG